MGMLKIAQWERGIGARSPFHPVFDIPEIACWDVPALGSVAGASVPTRGSWWGASLVVSCAYPSPQPMGPDLWHSAVGTPTLAPGEISIHCREGILSSPV